MKYIRVFHPSGRFAVQICSRQICHCCVIDGLFSTKDEVLHFDEAALTSEIITGVQAQVRERILRLFKRRELLSPEVADAMREWGSCRGIFSKC